jgi:hypothetical protein
MGEGVYDCEGKFTRNYCTVVETLATKFHRETPFVRRNR